MVDASIGEPAVAERILYALIASIVIVPPMLIIWAAYHQWRAGTAR